MARYASCVSISEAIAMDRNRLRKALRDHELVIDENENGFVYGKADDREIYDFIMDTFAEYAYEWLRANDCACVLSDILDEHEVKYTMPEFMKRMAAKAAQRYNPDDDDDCDPFD